MRAYVLTAGLRTPLQATRAIHLDGLLLAARERREGVLDLSRPLDCIAVDRGVYRASAGILMSQDPLGNAPHKIARVWRFRTDHHDHLSYFRLADGQRRPVAREERVLPPTNSPWRPHFSSRDLHSAVGAVSWQFVGDPDAVVSLAREIASIGQGANQGYGQVSGWTVDPCDADPAAAGWWSGDRVLRNLPVELAPPALRRGGDGFVVGRERVAPPYWDREDRRTCLVPLIRGLVAGYDAANERLGLAA